MYTFKRTVVKNKINTLIIKIAYEHGDGDATTYQTVELEKIDFSKDLSKFIMALNNIEENECNIQDVPVEGTTLIIPVESDMYSDGSISSILSIDKLTFFDENGIENLLTPIPIAEKIKEF
jgi:hypothetical protein